MSAISYQPFAYTKQLNNWHKEQWQTSRNFLETAAAVAKIFTTIPFYLLTFVADLVCSALCRRSIQTQPVNIPQAPVEPIPEERTPDYFLMGRILTCPVRPLVPNTEQFFRESLQSALGKYYTPEEADSYKNLIANSREEIAPIDIRKWSAACLLTEYLIAGFNNDEIGPYTYPKKHPDWDAIYMLPGQMGTHVDLDRRLTARQHEQGVQRLLRTFLQEVNTREDKAAVILQIMVPSTQWKLSANARRLVNEINGRALTMSQDPAFLRIYNPVAAAIANL